MDQVNDIPLVNHIAEMGRPVIMSTGMQNVDGVRPAVDILRKRQYRLHSWNVQIYTRRHQRLFPFRRSERNEAFPDAVVGFSDHSIGPFMSLTAVALGAIYRRHFTDGRYQGPHILCSMDPAELRILVDRSLEILQRYLRKTALQVKKKYINSHGAQLLLTGTLWLEQGFRK